MTHYLYILASRPGGALHIGRAGNLRQRLDAHRMGFVEQTKRNGIQSLVWFEACEGYHASASREKQLKRMRRAEKARLIEDGNPDWRDLTAQIPNPTGVRMRAAVKWGIRSGAG